MLSLLCVLLSASAALADPIHGYESDVVLSRADKAWREGAIRKLWHERKEMGYTPLVKVPLAGLPHATIYVKNETASPSGTLKHRFVWALTMWAVVEGKIRSSTPVYDSTSGNTGASEAYMCRLIGVNYTAVVANDLEVEKIAQITQFGGHIFKTDVSKRNTEAARLARENHGFYFNQFGNADYAEEYHESGNFELESSNVFHEILRQTAAEHEAPLDFFVHSAGTGGTISSVGKYISRYAVPTKVVLADSQFSLFYDYVYNNSYAHAKAGEPGRPDWRKPGLAGIGYGYNPDPIVFHTSTSLVRQVIDEIVRMPDAASVAAMRSLSKRGIDGGPSTALNFLVALNRVQQAMKATPAKAASAVLIMGDPADFYRSTYLNDTWISSKMAPYGGLAALHCWEAAIDDAIDTGSDFLESACQATVSDVSPPPPDTRY